jgi:hypothetical protein
VAQIASMQKWFGREPDPGSERYEPRLYVQTDEGARYIDDPLNDRQHTELSRVEECLSGAAELMTIALRLIDQHKLALSRRTLAVGVHGMRRLRAECDMLRAADEHLRALSR